jgi:hypothetical protein
MTVIRCRRAVGALILGAFASSLLAAQSGAWTFDDGPVGRPPDGFSFSGGPEGPTVWSVLRHGSNGVLAHVPKPPGVPRLAVVDRMALDNVSVSVRLRFREPSGAAGVVWRHADVQNHYLAAIDLRRQEMRVDRLANGTRTRLDQEGDLELAPDEWHLLKVEHQGMRMRVWINGVPVGGARDRAAPAAGSAGVWTSGEAEVWFDDLQVGRPAARERSRWQ